MLPSKSRGTINDNPVGAEYGTGVQQPSGARLPYEEDIISFFSWSTLAFQEKKSGYFSSC